MSEGLFQAVWDETMKMSCYRKVLFKLYERILQKHDAKGLSYLEMNMPQLRAILEEEIIELDKALEELDITNVIEEALDVAICGLLIADNMIHFKEFTEREYQ